MTREPDDLGTGVLVEDPESAPEPGTVPGQLELSLDGALGVARRSAPARPEDPRPIVLLVGGDPDVQRHLATALARRFRTVVAPEGLIGPERSLALHPDLVLCLVTTTSSAERAVIALRTRRELDGVPVLAVVPPLCPALRARLFRAGAQDVVADTVAAEELRARAGILTTLKRTRDALTRALGRVRDEGDAPATEAPSVSPPAASPEGAAAPRVRAAPDPGRPAGRMGSRPRTVLLAEDDAGTREYSCAVLEGLGYRVLRTRNGEEALRVWAAHRDEIDAVVTDLLMPRRGGVAVYRTVHHERADVPVIVMSGFPLIAEMLEARAEGVVECLQKPVDPEQLADALSRALA
jgi:CheY-like chemotaxis protein